MASPIIADADNVNDNIFEDNTSIASGILNCNNNDDKNYTDESYETTNSTTTTRTTATVTTTTTDEVTCELNHININECDRDILEVSEEIISKFDHGRYF